MKLQYMDLHAKAQAACSHFIQKMYRPCPDVPTGFCGLHCVSHLTHHHVRHLGDHMNVFRNILIASLFCSSAAMAASASEDSIKQLLAVTQAQKLVDDMRVQIDSLMNNSIQQVLKGESPTAKQQLAINNMKNRMVALIQGELAWGKLEPLYLRLYQESFTEEEVAGMLSFYKTPAGQAVIAKLPVLMQRTMVDMQKMIVGITPQMLKIQENFVAEMSAASE
jgi:hypothetical protein